MAVPLTGLGGFFVRQGVIVGEFNRVAALYGSDLTTGFQAIWQQFASSDQAAVQNLPDAVSAYAQTQNNYLNTLIGDGQLAITLQVSDDVDVVPYTVQRALQILISQMIDNSQSVNRPTLGSTVTAGSSNYSDATVVTSTTNQYGDPLDMIFAETVTVTCTSAATAYGESLTAVGQTAVESISPNWPGGSGANLTFSIKDPTVDGIVTDGGFESWGGTGNNTPTYWDIINGDAGVTVSRGSGGVRGSFTAVITSDGSSLTQLGQDVSLEPNKVYCFSVQAKIDSADGSGVFRIALTDDNGNILQNDAGANLSYTRNLSAQVTTSFQCFTVFFQTPRQLPTTVNLRMGFSTAPANGKFLTLDLAAGVDCTNNQLYAGGPFVAAFSGADRTAVDDYWSIAYTNSLTSQSFVRGMDRLYGMRTMNVYLPSSGSPTISDSLVLH